jgi:sterol desaturase/sphingolipid hydroxylase (fatty acid hydroxylase superfamily)
VLRSLVDALWLVTLVDVWTACFFVPLEHLRPSLRAQRHLRRGILKDLAFVYIASILHVALSHAGFDRAVGQLGTLASLQAHLATIPFFLQLALAVVVSDLFGYWKHRLMHTRWLWPLHAVHHSSEEIDWLSDNRSHPIEMIITSTFFVVPLTFLGFLPLTIGWAAQIRRLHSIYEHGNLGIDYGRGHYVLVSPTFHRWHHSVDSTLLNKNFANIFASFDWLFGTFWLPKEEPAAGSFGVPRFPRSLWGQLVKPYRSA